MRLPFLTEARAPLTREVAALNEKGERQALAIPAERDLTIYVARLKTLLNSSSARDRMAFVEDQATLRRMQGEEFGNRDPFEDASRNGIPNDPRVTPQYALFGTFYEMRNTRTSYFLCTFRMTDLRTGVQVWENSYEVRALN